MECYILVYVYRGIIETVGAYPYTPKGLKAAREEAKEILLNQYGEEDSLGVYVHADKDSGSDILSADEMKRWLIEAGKEDEANAWF